VCGKKGKGRPEKRLFSMDINGKYEAANSFCAKLPAIIVGQQMTIIHLKP
jgi:hypothetical protein